MDGLRGAGSYGALGNGNRVDGSVSILRRAGEAGRSEKSELGIEGGVDGDGDGDAGDASAGTSAPPRPIGNLGQHLDLRL